MTETPPSPSGFHISPTNKQTIIDLENDQASHLEFLRLLRSLHRLVRLPSGSRKLLRLMNHDDIRKRLLGSDSALRIGGLHDAHLHSQHTLLHQHMAHRLVHELLAGVSGLDHVALLELHRIRTLLTELAGHDHLAALRTSVQRAADHSVGSTAHRKTCQQSVLQGLGLRLGAQTALHDTLGVQNDVVLVEAKSTRSASLPTQNTPLLDQSSQLVDTARVLTDNLLRSGSTNNDLSLHGRLADAHARVTDLEKLTIQELQNHLPPKTRPTSSSSA